MMSSFRLILLHLLKDSLMIISSFGLVIASQVGFVSIIIVWISLQRWLSSLIVLFIKKKKILL